jgi:hypothetical protein
MGAHFLVSGISIAGAAQRRVFTFGDTENVQCLSVESEISPRLGAALVFAAQLFFAQRP